MTEYELSEIIDMDDFYTDNQYPENIDSVPLSLGTGREIIKYILSNDIDLSDWKLVKRGRK